MEGREDPPPPYLGNYPAGPYWSAVAPGDEADLAEDYAVEGSDLEIMWDEGGGPLWGIEGLLPDEPEWLQRALGISEALIADLLAWRNDMNVFNSTAQADWLAGQKAMDLRASELVDRLQAEVGTSFHVRYRP